LSSAIKEIIFTNELNEEKEQILIKGIRSRGKIAYYALSNGYILSATTRKFLGDKVSKEEYERTTLCIDGIKRTHLQINIVIATAFIPNPEKYPHVDHVNGNKHDNRICNLKWKTCSENNHNKGMDSKNTSGTKGVKLDRGKWCGYITINGKCIKKYFAEKEDAIKYRKELEDKYINKK
jgi:hypothetical protein